MSQLRKQEAPRLRELPPREETEGKPERAAAGLQAQQPAGHLATATAGHRQQDSNQTQRQPDLAPHLIISPFNKDLPRHAHEFILRLVHSCESWWLVYLR